MVRESILEVDYYGPNIEKFKISVKNMNKHSFPLTHHIVIKMYLGHNLTFSNRNRHLKIFRTQRKICHPFRNQVQLLICI